MGRRKVLAKLEFALKEKKGIKAPGRHKKRPVPFAPLTLLKSNLALNSSLKSIANDPKDGELCLNRSNRSEMNVEDRWNSNAQIDPLI